MFCVKCGMRITEDSKFCSYCGAQVPVRDKAPENPSVTAEKPVEEAVVTEERTVEVTETSAAEETPVETIETAIADEEKTAEITGTVAASEEAPVQTEEVPAGPVTGSELSDFSYAPVTPIKKKSRKGLAIGITAGILAGGAALGYFCFSNEISRFIMGDVAFARSVEKGTMSYMNRSPVVQETLSEAVADAVESSLTENKTVYNDDLDKILETYGDSEVTMSIDLDLDFFGAMAIGSELNRYLDSHSLVRVTQGEECNKISYVFIEKDEEIVGADVYTSDNSTVLTLPGLTEQVFVSDNVSEDGKTAEPFDPKEAKRITDRLSEIYYRAYDMAEITFTKGEFHIGEGEPVKCEEVCVYFNAELFSATVKEMADFLGNDEYFKTYCINSGKYTEAEYNEFFEKMKNTSGDFTCINYIKQHKKLCGKMYIIGVDTEEGRKTISGRFSKTENGADITFSVSDEYTVVIAHSENEENDDGKITVKVLTDGNENPSVFEIEYSNIDEVDYHGVKVQTGKYTLRLVTDAKDIINAVDEAGKNAEETANNAEETADYGYNAAANGALTEFFEDSYISWGTECDGDSVNTFFTVRIDSLGKITLDTEVVPYEGEEPVMPDTSGAIDLSSDFDNPEYDELKKEIYENILALGERSELIKAIGEYMELEDKLEEMEVASTYGVNYKNYTEKARMYADDTAEKLAAAFETLYGATINEKGLSDLNDPEYVDFLIKKAGPEGVKAKLYFDENGELQVIDDGGCYFLDFTKLGTDEYFESMYAEIFISPFCIASRNDNGGYATIVYTDDPANLPGTLPDPYNYYDRAFNWEGDLENIHENFIVGTSASVKDGISASRALYEELFADAEKYNYRAKQIALAAEEFFSGKEEDYFKYPFGTYDLRIEKTDGKWSLISGYDSVGFEKTYEDLFNGSEDEFLSFCDNSPLLTDVKAVTAEILMECDYENGHKVLGVNAALVNSEPFRDDCRGLPWAENYRMGYYTKWCDVAIYPNIAGIYIENSDPIALGTYCISTGKPLGDMRYLYEQRLEELSKGGAYDNSGAVSVDIEDMNLISAEIGAVLEENFFDDFMGHETDEKSLELAADYDPDRDKAVIFYNAQGELEIIHEGGFYFFDFSRLENQNTGKDYRNIYAEIRSIAMSPINIQVTSVATENPESLPSALPDMYSFCDGLFKWDIANEGRKDGFCVGTYPVLTTGEGDYRQMAEYLADEAETYNGYAEQLYRAAEEYFLNRRDIFNPEKTNLAISLNRENGQWKVRWWYDSYMQVECTRIFTEDITEHLTAYLNEKAAIGEDVSAVIMFSSMKAREAQELEFSDDLTLCGVSVIPHTMIKFYGDYGPENLDFVFGSYAGWSDERETVPYIKGVIFREFSGTPCGTWCALTDSPLNNYEKLREYFYPEGE